MKFIINATPKEIAVLITSISGRPAAPNSLAPGVKVSMEVSKVNSALRSSSIPR